MRTNSVFTISYWDNKRITLAAFSAAQKGSYIRKQTIFKIERN